MGFPSEASITEIWPDVKDLFHNDRQGKWVESEGQTKPDGLSWSLYLSDAHVGAHFSIVTFVYDKNEYDRLLRNFMDRTSYRALQVRPSGCDLDHLVRADCY